MLENYFKSGALREIHCAEAKVVQKELYLSIRADAISERMFNCLLAEMSAASAGRE
mgnify:CR=1 FL=1